MRNNIVTITDCQQVGDRRTMITDCRSMDWGPSTFSSSQVVSAKMWMQNQFLVVKLL